MSILRKEAPTKRIVCPEHGVITASVPWVYPRSSFTKDFDLSAAWLTTYLPHSSVAAYMRIDWTTVGRCINRALDDIEPEQSCRLNGLVNIGNDETNYKKGHKYITVIVNLDTNTVVWAAEGHGKSVLEQLYRCLTPEHLSSIRVVTGDGGRWITECVDEFTPDCERCVDPFYVVEWAMEALDEVQREIWREAYSEAHKLAKEHPQKPIRPKANDKDAAIATAAKAKADEIKNSAYALGKATEHLTENHQLRIEIIAANNPKLYKAYRIKEKLRLLLKIKSVDEAEAELKKWLWWINHSRIPAMVELNRKIRRHKEHILNTIRLGMSNL